MDIGAYLRGAVAHVSRSFTFLGTYGVTEPEVGVFVPVIWQTGADVRAGRNLPGLVVKAVVSDSKTGLGDLQADLDAQPKAAGAEQDVRLLQYKEDRRGKRYLVFRDGVDQLLTPTLKDMDYFDGPDTVIFCGRYMSVNSGTPLGYHNKFVADGGLDRNDPYVLEHESLCRLFQVGVEIDQLHASQLIIFELICPGIQRIESRFKDCFLGKLEIDSGGGKKGGGRARANPEQDLHLFLGSSSIRGRLCICPQLLEWLAERKHREYIMLKEDRKLVEERRALQSGKAPPDKI